MTKAKDLLIQLKEATKKKFKMSKTYETWDEDSIEAGDTDDRGFEYQDQEFDSLWELAKEIRDAGATEPSSGGTADSHTWYSTIDDDIDYKTGEMTNYSFHPSGLTQEEAEELQRLIKMDRRKFNDADPDIQDEGEESEEDQATAVEREHEKKNTKLPGME